MKFNEKIGKKLISILLVICLSFSMMAVAVPTASAGVGSFIGQKALELGLRFACKASTELAAQCDNDNALIVVSSVINLLLLDGHGVTTNNISKMCEDILAELEELEEDVRVYTADISASIQKQNLLVSEVQYTNAWKSDVSDVLSDYSVNKAFDAYVKYFIASTLNVNGCTNADLTDSLRTYWEDHYHDALSADDFTDAKVQEYRNQLEKEFVEIYDPTNGLNNKDSAYKNVLIFNKFSGAIDQLTQNFIRDSVGTDKKDYSVVDYAAADAYYGLPYSSQQYEFVNSTAKHQIMIVTFMQMALNEYLSMQGEYLNETYGGDWNSSLTLEKDGVIDNSSTYDHCKAKYQEIVENSLQESVYLMESDITLNTVAYTGNKEDIKFKLSDYMNPADATKVKLSINDYESSHDYKTEIAKSEADNSMKLGNTVVNSKKIPSELTFYRVMSGGTNPEIYYILDPTQFDDADALDLNNFKEHIKRYGPTGGSDSLYGDLYPVGLDYLNLIKPMSDGANTFSIPNNIELTSEYANLIKVPCFSATSNFLFKDYLGAFLPASTGGNTYLLSSGYNNNFNEGGNTEVKDASINLANTATGLGNDYKIETESVRVKDLSDNYHNYSAILTNDGDSYSQNIKITTDDKADTINYATLKYGNLTISKDQTYAVRSGETVSIKFGLLGDYSTFDSLVMVRHNQDDTETVLLDREDLLNNLEPEYGVYTFDIKMPYSDTEIIVKTKTEDNFDTDENGNYIIRTYQELYEMAYRINTGNEKYTQATYILANDIDCEDYTDWVSAANTSLFYLANPTESSDWGFKGTFDGNGHVIKNLSVDGDNVNDESYGVFGTLSGTIKNLGVENFTFKGGDSDSRVGAIAGQVLEGGLITDCYVATADINTMIQTNMGVAGGIAGANYAGSIKNCHAYDVNITAARAGGIVGDNYGDGNNSNGTDRPGVIDNCYTTATDVCNRGVADNSKANVSTDTFASGEITYLLNKGVTDGTQIWYQNIDNGLIPDNYPVFVNNNENTVYKVNLEEKTYSNFTREELDPSLLLQSDLRTYQRIIEKGGTLSEKSKIAMGYGLVDNNEMVINVYMADTAERMGVLMHQGVDGKKGVLKLQGDYPKYSKTSGELLSDPNFVEPDIYTDGNGCIFISQPEDGSQVPELTVEYTAKPLEENEPILYTLKVTIVDTSIFTSGMIAGGMIMDTLDKDDPDYAVVQDSASTDTDKELTTIPSPSEDASSSTSDEAEKESVKTDNGAVQTGNPVSAVLLLGVLLAGFVILFVYRRKYNN